MGHCICQGQVHIYYTVYKGREIIQDDLVFHLHLNQVNTVLVDQSWY